MSPDRFIILLNLESVSACSRSCARLKDFKFMPKLLGLGRGDPSIGRLTGNS